MTANGEVRDFQDSREELDRELREVCWGNNVDRLYGMISYCKKHGLTVSESNVLANHEGHAVMTVVEHMLDRQAAIVERHWRGQVDALAAKGDQLSKANAELRDAVEELKAERDKWKAQCDELFDQRERWTGVAEGVFNRLSPQDEFNPFGDPTSALNDAIDRLISERDEAVEAYDAHMAAHDAWHEAEDIKYTRNRFTVLEQAKNERIAALEAERDYWRGQMERCVAAAVKPERHAEGVMAYPRDELRFAEPALLVVDAIDSLRDFHADDRIANRRLAAECDALAHDLVESEKLRDELVAERGEIAELVGWLGEVDGNGGKAPLVPMVAAMCDGSVLATELKAELAKRDKSIEQLERQRDEADATCMGQFLEIEELREKLSEAIGHASEITRLQDLEVE